MLPTAEQIHKAVQAMGAPGMVRYFPADEYARELIAEELLRMVPSVDALRWLVSALVREVGEWRSLQTLRALLCTRFDPRDGIMAYDASLPYSFSAEYSEFSFLEKQASEHAAKLAEWKREAKQIEGSTQPLLEGVVSAAAGKALPREKPKPEEKKIIGGGPTRVRTPEERAEIEADLRRRLGLP